MLASIPAYWWAKQGRQVCCKVSCKAFRMALLQLEVGGKHGWRLILRHSFPQGIFPSLQVCFKLPGLAWEHSDPTSDNVDLCSDSECFHIILPGGLLFRAQTQSKALNNRRASQLKGRANAMHLWQEWQWQLQRAKVSPRTQSCCCHLRPLTWLGLPGNCASSWKKLNSEHNIFSLVS